MAHPASVSPSTSETATRSLPRTTRPLLPARATSMLRSAAIMVLLAVAYFVCAKLGTQLISVSVVPAVWPASGVALAALLVFGTRYWPGVAAGAFAETLANGIPIPICAGVAVAQTAAPLAAIAVLRSLRFDRRLTRLVDVVALSAVGAVGSSLIAAAIGPSVFALGGYFTAEDWPLAWLVWWVGDAIGVLVVTPVLLLLAVPRDDPSRARPGRGWAEPAVVLGATAVASVRLFDSTLPLVFLIFPFALWAAVRLNLLGAAAGGLLVAAIAVWTTVRGDGPFADLPSTLRLVSLQSFNASIVITSLMLAVAIQERRRALEDVRRSRARIVEAGDVERRRLERDLHDGAQQRLVSLSYSLGLAMARLDGGDKDSEVAQTLHGALAEARAAQSELRSLAHGLHPAVLAQEGLGAALESLAEQNPVPIEVSAPVARYPPVVEATAYFIVCEALTNVAKHSGASRARVRLEQRKGGRLLVEVTDDGVGGADPSRGTGLTGLSDRAAALGGCVTVEGARGGGTRLVAELPCDWS